MNHVKNVILFLKCKTDKLNDNLLEYDVISLVTIEAIHEYTESTTNNS